MTRVFFFLIGFVLMIVGNIFLILYLNFLTLEYNLTFYVNFITRRIECYFSLIGLIIIILTIFIKGAKKNELHI